MNRRLQYALAVAGAAAALLPQAASAALIGQWDFNSGTLNGTVGAALAYGDGAGAATQAGTAFGTTTALGVPDIGGTPANIMKFPASTLPGGYAMPINATANGGGSLVNQWTIIMDVLFPTASNSKWRGLIDTDGGAINADAEFFVNTGNGIGIGSYAGTIQPNTWHRVAFVVDQSEGVNRLRGYIDGVEVIVLNPGNNSNNAGLDGRWALSPGSIATLFSDNDGETAEGFVNSVQIYDTPLSRPQIAAFGAPTAAGLPTTLPPIPAFIENWIPKGAFGNPGTEVGLVLNKGSVNVTGITANYDGSSVTPTVATVGDLITIKVPGASTPARTDHTLIVNYTDSVLGARSITNRFRIPLNFEDFDSVVLGPNVDEGRVGEKVYSKDGPPGWTVDNSQMPKNAETGASWEDQGMGVTEFKGWTFLDRDWWVATAGDQTRSQFTLGTGTVVVADPDEWDDLGNPDRDVGYFTSFFSSPNIPISGAPANGITLKFSSSWRPEARDDTGPDGLQTNDQTGVVRVSFDGGAAVEVLRWNSVDGSPTFKPDSQNEEVTLAINNPAGATTMKVTFGLLNAGNDWWWAVDNFVVDAGSVPPPVLTAEPADATSVAGQGATFNGAATGAAVTFQWLAGETPIPAGTNASLTLSNLTLSQAGGYKLVASNGGGSVTSRVATLTVLPALTDNSSLRTGLRTYLPFDGNYNDASGNNINASPMGSPTFVAGAVGSGAMLATTISGESVFNYATLGNQIDFGTTQSFSVSFWAKITSLSGDPGLIGNKDWDSGGNPGFVIFTTSGRRARWNYRSSDSARVDSNVAPEAFPTDQWGHVVVSYDRGGNATTYVNGNLIDTRPLGPNGTTFQADGMSLNIGQDGAGDYGSNQVAAYDEVAIWTRAITQQEAALIYQSGAAGRSFLVAPPAAIMASASLVNGDVKLSWTGGTAPYLVQGATTLTGEWIDIVTTSASEVTIPAVGPVAFLRVQDRTTKMVHLFKADINAAQEVATPAVVSPATGKGFFSITGLNAFYYISFEGTVGNVTASHLHNAAAGANGPVMFHLLPSPSFPANTRGGILSGTQVLTATQLTEILGSRTYINIHSTAFPAGELRGQLLP
jgi:hypothetical protein